MSLLIRQTKERIFEYKSYSIDADFNSRLVDIAKLKNMEPIDVLEMLIENEYEDYMMDPHCYVHPEFEERKIKVDSTQHDKIMNSPQIMQIRNKIDECDNQIQYLEKIKESHEDGITRIFEAQYHNQEKMLVVSS